MITLNPNSLCRQAEQYYYDFLHKESQKVIPGPIIEHLERCQRCREQIGQLRAMLSHAEEHIESGQRQFADAITLMLKLHFAYVSERVTCQTVRPFLPSLLDPALEIRIPTPITIHLNNCGQCSEDLEAIRRLNLNHKQLCRLSQLFAESSPEYGIGCSEAQAAIQAVVLMDFHQTNAAVLKHFCTCSDCRKLLYRDRETIRRKLVGYDMTREGFPCEAVSATDIFDYAVPYGINPADDQYAKFRKSFTSHVLTCPTCLAKMQQLHNIVYEIVERPESGVITIVHIDESAKAQAVTESDDIYAGFPVRAEVIHHKDEAASGQPVSAVDSNHPAKRKVSTIRLKPLLKTGIAAAAVILIAFGLFFSAPKVRAVTLQEIFKAIGKAQNVHISNFVSGETTALQERWISRPLNICMIKRDNQWVLWDVAKRVRKSKLPGSDAIEMGHLTDKTIVDIEELMAASLGLVPFNMSEVPPDAEWNRVHDDTLKGTDKNVQLYDLNWTIEIYDGFVRFCKHRFFLDPGTKLPHKTELYEKLESDDEYTLVSLNLIEYLNDGEMQAVIKDAGF